ncbi:MAG: hypothetical protein AAFM92_15205 [Pseudomonadota bacterium]
MEIEQVIELAEWFERSLADIETQYEALVSVLQNNSQHPNQQPVSQPLKDLMRELSDMTTSELSTMQIHVLEQLDVAHLVGRAGKDWVRRKVQSTTFDPATTFQTIKEGLSDLQQARTKLKSLKSAAIQIGFSSRASGEGSSPYVLSVVFQNDASIETMQEWKRSASDWELIVAGAAEVAGEKSSDVSVVGAQNGSIILTLSAAPIVTKILATISKHIASMANDYLDFQ